MDGVGTPAPAQPGISFLADLSSDTAAQISGLIERTARPNDIVVVSIHWGAKWGYDIPAAHRRFAHALIDGAGVAVVHGHSSHDPKAIEVYRRRLILYGCGDFLNDYEGTAGYEQYRGDLILIYFVDIIPETGGLKEVCLVPLQIKRFQLARAAEKDVHWIRMTLERESSYFGAHFAIERPGQIAVHW